MYHWGHAVIIVRSDDLDDDKIEKDKPMANLCELHMWSGDIWLYLQENLSFINTVYYNYTAYLKKNLSYTTDIYTFFQCRSHYIPITYANP